jgi:hypothetical protein
MTGCGMLLIALGWCLKGDERLNVIGSRGIIAGMVLINIDLILAAIVLVVFGFNLLPIEYLELLRR